MKVTGSTTFACVRKLRLYSGLCVCQFPKLTLTRWYILLVHMHDEVVETCWHTAFMLRSPWHQCNICQCGWFYQFIGGATWWSRAGKFWGDMFPAWGIEFPLPHLKNQNPMELLEKAWRRMGFLVTWWPSRSVVTIDSFFVMIMGLGSYGESDLFTLLFLMSTRPPILSCLSLKYTLLSAYVFTLVLALV